MLYQQALEQFSTDAADTENDPAKESIFDEKVCVYLSIYLRALLQHRTVLTIVLLCWWCFFFFFSC